MPRLACPRSRFGAGSVLTLRDGIGHSHRSCSPAIGLGCAVVLASSSPILLAPQIVPEGKYYLRAEAMTLEETGGF